MQGKLYRLKVKGICLGGGGGNIKRRASLNKVSAALKKLSQTLFGNSMSLKQNVQQILIIKLYLKVKYHLSTLHKISIQNSIF